MGQGRFLKSKGPLINIFSIIQKRKDPQGNISRYFFRDTVKNTFYMRNLTHRWPKSGHFFPI